MNNKLLEKIVQAGVWSSGMILASGARGREFDSRNAPYRLRGRKPSSFLTYYFF
jgi:hypothetical protein